MVISITVFLKDGKWKCDGDIIPDKMYHAVINLTPKESKMKASNKEIVQAAESCIDKYERWLDGAGEVGVQADCALCSLFVDKHRNCACNCVFPKCYDKGTSFYELIKHWKVNHWKYVKGNKNVAKCVGRCCIPFGEAVIKDLQEIKKKYSEVERTYKFGDVFDTDYGKAVLSHIGGRHMVLVIFEGTFSGNRFGDTKRVDEVGAVTKDELSVLVKGYNIKHISGPTYIEENKCPCGYEFGKDYKKCPGEKGHSECNDNPIVYLGDKGCEEKLWYKCQQAYNRGGK